MPTIAILGATGMLARPVIRRLVESGYTVRALSRDADKARRLLPAPCDCRSADLRDPDSIARAIDGCDTLHINLSNPQSPSAPDPDLIGTRSAVIAAQRAAVGRILRISAIGVTHNDPWWVIRRKAKADAAVAGSGIPFTIFRPSWFMESLPLFLVGPMLLHMRTPMTTWWIAGDDYARQFVAALANPAAIGRGYDIQGPAPLSMRDAIRRFADAWTPRPIVAPMPAFIRRTMARVVTPLRYLTDLMDYYIRAERGFTAQPSWDDLGAPTMTIADYARYAREVRDVPRK